MGTVWQAHDELLGRTIAIKEINLPQLAQIDRAELRERAMREARAAALLSHPNAITVHDVVEEDGNPWIVMAFVDSDSLADLLRSSGPLPPTRVAEIGLAVLNALEEAHALGILHRDVKPGNVLLGSGGRIVLTDFGIATLEGDPAMTTAGLLLGAPAYMAPERAAGLRLGPASDLWSLGATLYAAVEGRPPYDRESAVATLTALMNEDLPFPRAAGQLAPILLGLLVRDPARRLDAPAARRMLETCLREPTMHMTRVAPTLIAGPVDRSRVADRSQVVARPQPAAVPTSFDRAPHPTAIPTVLNGRPEPLGATPTAFRSRPAEQPAHQGRRPSRWWAARIAMTASTTVALLIAAIANPWMADLVAREDAVPSRLYEILSFPSWVVTDPPVHSLRTAIAFDARAVLLVVLVGIVGFRLCRALRVRRGRIFVLVVVWFAVVASAALAGLLGSPLINGVLGDGMTAPRFGTAEFALSQASEGAIHGVAVGWLPALLAAAVAGRRRT